MKSWRLKIVALTWLHGGHQVAPQYRNTGFPSAFAATKAASTSPLRHAMPASSLATGVGAAATGGAAGGGTPEWAVGDGSGDFEHAVSAMATSRTAIFSVMIDGASVRAC